MTYSRWNRVPRGRVVALAKAGRSTISIARELGCSEESVRKIRNLEGVPRAHFGPEPRALFRAPRDPIMLAYLAGLVDGEGTVGLFNGQSLGGKVPSLFITNTDETLIDWLVDTLGGRKQLTAKATATTKACYRWWAGGYLSVRDALRVLKPYLRVKTSNAEKVLQRCEWMIAERRSRAFRREGRS